MVGYNDLTQALIIILSTFSSTLLALLLFSISACSAHSDAVYLTTFNFSNVKTYSIYQRDSTFTETQNLTDSRRNSIEIAIEKILEQQGFQYQEVDKADLVITYHMLNGKKNDYHDYNKEVRFCNLCLKANNWYNKGSGLTVKKGSLIIDLVDPKIKRSVWRSIAPLNIKDKDNSRVVNEKIQQEVMLMFQQYPSYSQNNN